MPTQPDLPPSPEPDAPLPEEPSHGHALPSHLYDGIREYDNPMPRWWVQLFWVTILWAPVYILGVHVFGWIPTYGDHLSEQTAQLEEVRAAYAAANPVFSTEPAALAAYAANPDNAAAGAAVYATTCLACHGDKGQGGIGPNLTDDYWLHGAKPEEIFTTITKGVLEKGMPPQETVLSDEQRGQLVAFVLSIHDTHPPGAKEPQGVEVEDED